MNPQFGSNRQASSLAYASANALIWVIYLALVLAVIQTFRFHTPVAEAAATLATALAAYPLRRWAAHAARRRLSHR